MGSITYLVHFIRRYQDGNNDMVICVDGIKGSGKSTLCIQLTREYVRKFGFICPHCRSEFYKNLYTMEKNGNSYRFYIPEKIKNDQVLIQCPEYYDLNLSTSKKEKVSGCGKFFKWSERKKVRWDADKFIAYTNTDCYNKLLKQPHYSPLVSDEAMNYLCLTEDTRIKMPRDIRKYPNGIPIRDLINKENFYVYSWDIKENKLNLSKCKGCYYVKDDHVFELELKNGIKIQATSDHKFVTFDGEIKQLKDLVWFKKCTRRIVNKREGEKPISSKTKILRTGKSFLLWEYSDKLRLFCENINKNRNYLKVNMSKTRMQESRFIYKEINGEIPPEFIVHHKNNNKLDNNVDNLEGMTFSEHSSMTIKKIGCPHKIIKKEIKYINYNIGLSEAAKKAFGGGGAIIKSIKYVGIKPVYTLVEVEKNHNYFANDILVMNSGQDHNKVESKEMKKLFTVIRPKRRLIFLVIPSIKWIDSKYREEFSHLWIHVLERGSAVCFEKDKGITKDAWHLAEVEKSMGVVRFFSSLDKIKRKLKKIPTYFDSFIYGELDQNIYDEYEYVRNAHNLRQQIEEQEIGNNDLAKIMTYNLLNEWDRIKLEVNKSKGTKLTYSILRQEILKDPYTNKILASETTVRNWVRGIEEYIKTKGKNASWINNNSLNK